MVPVQEAARVSAIPANDADPVGAVESLAMAQGKGDARKLDLLDWNIYRSQSLVQSLLDHLIAAHANEAMVLGTESI